MSVLALLLVLVSRIVGDVQRAWQQSSAKVYQFREARRAFDLIKTNVSQATLNAYTRYYYNNPTNPFLPYNISQSNQGALNTAAQQEYQPLGFTLFSELQFLTVPCNYLFPAVTGNGQVAAIGHSIFFQAPLGQTLSTSSLISNIYGTNAGAAASNGGVSTPSLPTALNARGYFVLFGSDAPWRPPFLTPDRIPYKLRYRLMEFAPTSEYNLIYGDNVSSTTNPYAYDPSQCSSSATPLAGPVITMNTSQWILAASGGTTPNYLQWSRPIADNVLTLIIAPQSPVAKGSTALPTDLAPDYYYNSSAYQISNTPGTVTLPPWAFQLPPEVQITMIVIDELSAETLANASAAASGSASPTPPLSFLSGTNLFGKASSFTADLASVQSQLSQFTPKLNWRIFTATIVLRNARWNGTSSS